MLHWCRAVKTVLRHEPKVRESDGAVYWPKLVQWIDDTHFDSRSWHFSKWLVALSAESDRVRFEYCVDPHGEPKYIRSLRSQQLFTLPEIPYEWKVHIYHTGASNNFRSIVKGGQIAGGTSASRGRPACFFSVMDSLEELCPLSSSSPRTNIAWRTGTFKSKSLQLLWLFCVTPRRYKTSASQRRDTLVQFY